MKTIKLTKLAQIAVGVLIALTVACDKKGSDPAPAPAPAPVYHYVNGACHDVNNQPVAANLCANLPINGNYRWNGTTCTDANNVPVAASLCQVGNANGNYRWNGVTCTDLNNQPVSPALCSPMGLNEQFRIIDGNCIHMMTYQWVNYSYCSGVTGYNANQCNGMYMKFYGSGAWATIQCFGSFCRGQTLTEVSTGRQVTCQ
jgi:hypothetical protein